ncbi:glutaredoxin-like protein [Staphylothermus marinus F1]|uniref:Glutaredoxin-like protein n=1 Tax=Staphylothermus marinus (strain ATCC 43588 / DSM 3639 / JCM 9404 / F1) TaxID=399550 RepID=A3DKZ8_STAMF|nr:thioredoxin family protein [Staphylothermus marinus]ABN69308.1 glutaredoxin-like protein [Staphylothermus marinus F1]
MSADELFDEETKQALKQIFQQFQRKVVDYLVVEKGSESNPDPNDPDDEHEHTATHIHPHPHVHHHHGCPTCGEAEILAKALMELADGKLEFKIIDKNSEEAKQLHTRYVPAFIYGSPKKNIRYYGLPSGQEFAPFIYVHLYIANNDIKLPENVIEEAKKIDVPLHIKIFVTPECPYCPLTVDAFNQLALINDKILVETIEAIELPLEADMYNVAYVPDVIITDPDKMDEYGVEPVERINGYMPIEEAINIVKYAAEKLKEMKKQG